MKINECHDCGAKEGEIHELGCDMERCPKCGNQLISCSCFIHHSSEFLKQLERIPYIQYPNICQKCGEVWSDLFQVSDKEWKKYIQIDMRDKIICRKCYDFIKSLIDNNSF